MKSVAVNIRVSEQEKAHLDRRADAEGKTVSDVVRDALFSGDEMPPEIWTILKKSAEAMQLPVSTLITHKIIKEFAFQQASFKTYGRQGSFWQEIYFGDTDDGLKRLITGTELFYDLEAYYLGLFKQYNDNIKALVESSGKAMSPEKFREFVAAI